MVHDTQVQHTQISVVQTSFTVSRASASQGTGGVMDRESVKILVTSSCAMVSSSVFFVFFCLNTVCVFHLC